MNIRNCVPYTVFFIVIIFAEIKCFRINQDNNGIQKIKKEREKDVKVSSRLIEKVFEKYPYFLNDFLDFNISAADGETHKVGYIKEMVLEVTRNDGYQVLTTENIEDSFLGQHSSLFTCSEVRRYIGNPKYSEYLEGDYGSQIILVSGDNGQLKPKSIAKRDAGCLIGDKCVYNHHCENKTAGVEKDFKRCKISETNEDCFSTEMTEMLSDELEFLTGYRPHVVINNLHQTRVNVNLPPGIGTFEVDEARRAWHSFHKLLYKAQKRFKGKKGLLIDVHANSKTDHIPEIAFNYGLFKESENTSSSIDSLMNHTSLSFHELTEGKRSMSHYMDESGYNVTAVPQSALNVSYVVEHYGSNKRYPGRNIDAVQVDMRINRKNKKLLKTMVEDLSSAVYKFLLEYY
ncbi:uncharacterized protein LOC100197587 [Hydra vulgaris]|uniref:uncharacterized protein LOC100197587 n=1 Tax=Hydra vulgaris TaxID=6087 RepID=UPI0002B4636B|nr:uncharacterized protein LOC100197587 [Hydra vulgaris]